MIQVQIENTRRTRCCEWSFQPQPNNFLWVNSVLHALLDPPVSIVIVLLPLQSSPCRQRHLPDIALVPRQKHHSRHLWLLASIPSILLPLRRIRPTSQTRLFLVALRRRSSERRRVPSMFPTVSNGRPVAGSSERVGSKAGSMLLLETMSHRRRRQDVQGPSRRCVIMLDIIYLCSSHHPFPQRDTRDRFITSRETSDDVTATLDVLTLNPQSASPGHTARLAAATGVPINRRILAYHEPPPASASDSLLSQQRDLVRPLYSSGGAQPSTSSSTSNKARRISSQPEKVLDAPGIFDDYYLNLISWSCGNILAVALGENTYIWKADSGDVVHLGEVQGEEQYISSVDFSNDGQFLGVGVNNGDVELWDIETQTKLRTMGGHSSQVACLSWNTHILSSGCGDGSIWHHDVRVAKHKIGELLGHQGEVCGLKWRSDGELLASGGNDNVVNVWDGRVGDVGTGTRGAARWTKRNHTAAVKVSAKNWSWNETET